jgi:iron complex outermembrane receptor protein
VVDAAGAPVRTARVQLVERGRLVLSDADGRFRFESVGAGRHQLSVTRIGFAPVSRVVELAPSEALEVQVELAPAVVELAPLQVTATVLPTSVLDAPQAVATIDSADLRTSRAPSLGETLGQVPGSHNSSTGPGIGRPVVRGLTGNRVLVVADGQRLEFQQWGEEHAPSLEVQDAAAVEIVRGPASVLYGSDALGGVVNVIARPLPEAPAGASVTNGRAWLGYISNNTAPDASVALEGARGNVGWRAFLGGQRGRDLVTPSGALANSGYGSWAGSGIAGLKGDWGRGQLMVSQKDERFEISEDPAVDSLYSGYQRVGTTRARAEATLPAAGHRVELAAGFERNRRREYASASNTDVTTGLAADLVTLDARLLHAPIGRFEGAAGVSFSRLGFAASGTEPFLPDYGWWNAALYGFEQVRAGPALLALGLRVDHRELDVAASDALAVPAQQLSWTAFSGNIGTSLRLSDGVSLVANLGRGFRAPQAPELFANGVHQGTLAYEIGNPGLGIEQSWNVDAGIRLATSRVSGELNVFRNAVDGFIYYRPTGEREPRTGLEIFRFTQGEALLTGFEASLAWLPLPQLLLTVGADVVRGENRSLGVPLPFMPPFRALYSVRYSGIEVPGLRGVVANAGMRGETMAQQHNPDPQEFAPAGFTRIDLEGGIVVPTRSGDVSLDLALRNVGNVRYTRPLNRFKTFAAERARHLVVRVGIPF